MASNVGLEAPAAENCSLRGSYTWHYIDIECWKVPIYFFYLSFDLFAFLGGLCCIRVRALPLAF